ncbi:MAG: CYTH domain-containing protein [Planctomycetota bacterium]|nr:MAG: CYTH domain-containing protein [Planctomycetota bacterium]REK24501.1 MAG: CYTH domain-containing protein [Planctomycetota bacterium]REK32462.1 MAG: CYTH domain-containing protein [Planctomycetota bacterium]
MPLEIERKFLVRGTDWRQAEGTPYRQGYLNTAKERTVRVRTAGNIACLTIKGETEGASRAEYEYPVPFEDAEKMLDSLCERPLIEKTRHRVEHEGLIWEVDEFGGENAGLVIAEVELESEDQDFARPSWVGDEVTDDPRYFNANLVSHPYSEWS